MDASVVLQPNFISFCGEGEYVKANGSRAPINGDTRRMLQAVGLTAAQRAILQNMQFISSRVPGTRQVRRGMNHVIFSAKIVYGLPVICTITPSERHNGLALRLTRYRRRDPAVDALRREIGVGDANIIGSESPSLEQEVVDVDIPAYDIRKLLSAKDPLCVVDAFIVITRVLLPALLDVRMCPACPRCADTRFSAWQGSAPPCTDMFGSNAEAMGGIVGGFDAFIGGVEAQKKEGVLHLHVPAFLQTAWQHMTLAEIAVMLREKMLLVQELEEFVNYTRRATCPDQRQFEQQRLISKPPCPRLKACKVSAKCDRTLLEAIQYSHTCTTCANKRRVPW